MKPSEQDRKGQDLLDQLDGLQSAHEQHRDEPPLMIDQAVRNMARRALQTPAARKTRGLGWIAGLSTASVALIALGISLIQTPNSSLPPLKPSLESMSPAPADIPTSREVEAKRLEMRSPSDQALPGTLPRKADRPSAAATQAVDMPAKGMALEELSVDSSEAYLSDAVQKQKKEVQKDSAEVHPEAEAWLDLISQLQEQGLEVEALTQLEAFRTHYPDIVLPLWAQNMVAEREREPARE